MKALSKYQCEYCKTEFSDKLECKKCENNHKIKADITWSRYLPIGVDHSGYPIDINIKFEDGKTIKYKRG